MSSIVEDSCYIISVIITAKINQKIKICIGIEKHNDEGRLIVAEYDDHYIVVCCKETHPLFSQHNINCRSPTDVPNAGEGLKRLKYRQDWDADLRAYLKKLDQIKPVIFCGDMNVAHHPIGNLLE